MSDTVAKLFAQVLLICDRQGLFGRQMFAIEGVQLPANASKAKSGTRADYQRQLDRMELATTQILEKHKSADGSATDDAFIKRDVQKLEHLQTETQQQLCEFLAKNLEDRKGNKGMIQGYTGVATVDEKAQIIVDAQAHGTGSEQELLLPVIGAVAALRNADTVITADAGYHSTANLKALDEQGINAYIPDKGYRKRDASKNDGERMKVKIDSVTGREMITRRFATVELVFGNFRGNKRLHRFTLRGKIKVDGQCELYSLMHNIEKLANHG